MGFRHLSWTKSLENAEHYYDVRKKTEFKRNNVRTVYNGTETLTFLGPRIWEIVKVLTTSWFFIAFYAA